LSTFVAVTFFTFTTGGNIDPALAVVELLLLFALGLTLGDGDGEGFAPSTKNITTAATAIPPPAAYTAFVFKTMC
jgi:hypothetical protein